MSDDLISILFLLKPKASVSYLEEDNTLRQALEKMRFYGYTALPVINQQGQYVGTISEGDFLWNMLENSEYDIYSQEKHRIREIIRKDFNPAATVSTTVDQLIPQIMSQNFIPVIDDLGVFMGIITRQDVIRYLSSRQK